MDHNRIFESLKAFLKAAKKQRQSFVICYADVGGNPVLTYRMPGAWLGSVAIAQGKAYTAVAFSGTTDDKALPTSKLSEMVQPGQPLYGIGDTNGGRLVVFGGGIPVYADGKLVGAIGVSGSTVDDDIEFAQIAVDAYDQQSQEED